jgi:hypothetical protein
MVWTVFLGPGGKLKYMGQGRIKLATKKTGDIIGEKIDRYPFWNGADYVYNETPPMLDLKARTIIKKSWDF